MQFISPKLTIVEQPFYEIGYETLVMLDSQLKKIFQLVVDYLLTTSLSKESRL